MPLFHLCEQYIVFYLVICTSLSNHAMFVHDLMDEVVLPGDFPTFVGKKTIETFKTEGKKIIHDAENFIQEKKHDFTSIFEILPNIEKRKKRQRKLIELRKKKSSQNKFISEVSEQESIGPWGLIKRNKNTIAVATSAALLLLTWKIIRDKKRNEERPQVDIVDINNEVHEELSDEKILANFNNQINNEFVSYEAKIDIANCVAQRLIDCKKKVSIELLKSFLNQYDQNNEIVKTIPKEKIGGNTNSHTIANLMLKLAIEQFDLEAIKLLFSSALYLCDNTLYLCHRRKAKKNCYDADPIRLYQDYMFNAIFTVPESKKKEDCLIFLLTRIYHRNPSFSGFSRYCRNHNLILPEILYEERIEKYVTLCIPYIHEQKSADRLFDEIENTLDISPTTFKRILTFFLECGKISHGSMICGLINSLTSEYVDKWGHVVAKRSVSDFVQSRIDMVEQLLRYGLYCFDYEEKIEKEKNKFKAIEDGKFCHVSAKDTKDSICNALDTIKIIGSKEREFREKFFTYKNNGQKDYYALLKTLREEYPRPAWWIKNIIIGDRFNYDPTCRSYNHDILITDLCHIPQFCFDEMNNLLFSRTMSDIDLKEEMRSWKNLMFFLLKKAPYIFTINSEVIEIANKKKYTVEYQDLEKEERQSKLSILYQDKKMELEQLLLAIVEQGYFEKPEAYKLLRPLFKHCIETNNFVLDISVQNKTEGSIFHLFARSPFDLPMLRYIFTAYRKKDPRLLYLACFENNKNRFHHERSTPKDIAKKMLKNCGDDEKKQKLYQEVLNVLRYDVLTIKQKASSHCPYIDTVITDFSDLQKTTEWQVNHCPNI